MFRYQHDLYTEYGRQMVLGDLVEHVGRINGQVLPDQETFLKKEGKKCAYYLRIVCLVSGASIDPENERRIEVARAEGPFYGLQLEPSESLTGLVRNVIPLNTDEPGIRVADSLPPDDKGPDDEFDPDELDAEVRLHTCVRRSRLKNSFAEVLSFFREYLVQLKSLFEVPIPYHGFIQIPGSYNGQDCMNGAPSCVHFVNRIGGDRTWTLYEETDEDGTIRVEDFPAPPADLDLHALFFQCQWSGGEILDPGDSRWGAARQLCSPSNWQCGYLMSRATAAHQRLYYEGGTPIIGSHKIESLRDLFWNASEPEVQNEFNQEPFALTILNDKADNMDYMITKKGSLQMFPTFSSSRALCVFSEDNPAARLAGVIHKFKKDLDNLFPTEVGVFKARERQLESIITGFNLKQDEKYGEEEGDCQPLSLPISNEVQGLSLIHI